MRSGRLRPAQTHRAVRRTRSDGRRLDVRAGRAGAGVRHARFAALRWRSIGPYRGGRVTAVAGVASQPNVYYFGATGGGVWKTEDSGVTWLPVSDGYFFTGSVGALAVAQSNPNVVYAGMGEACVRSNFSEGDGVYKSSDAGRTWTSMGLVQTKQIGRIAVHPTNPDIVFVAALGNVFGPSRERGVFRSIDGGTTWQQRALRERRNRGRRSRDRSARAGHHLRHVLARAAQALGALQRRSRQRTLQVHRRRQHLVRADNAGCPPASRAASVSPCRRSTASGSGPSSRPSTVACSARTMEESSWMRTNDEARIRERSWYYSHIFADTKEHRHGLRADSADLQVV